VLHRTPQLPGTVRHLNATGSGGAQLRGHVPEWTHRTSDLPRAEQVCEIMQGNLSIDDGSRNGAGWLGINPEH
jgi:hypothetical protein